MRIISFSLAAAAALCIGAPSMAALTQDASADDEALAERGFNASNTIICRRLPPPVGQRFGHGRRICATEAQWQRYQDDVRNTVNEAYNRSKVFSSN